MIFQYSKIESTDEKNTIYKKIYVISIMEWRIQKKFANKDVNTINKFNNMNNLKIVLKICQQRHF